MFKIELQKVFKKLKIKKQTVMEEISGLR